MDDRSSTGNLRRHARVCWGDETITKADTSKDLKYARKEVEKIRNVARDGSITAAFSKVEGQGRVGYSHRQFTADEIW